MMPAEITDLLLLDDDWLRLWFADGAIIDVDAEAIIATGEVFAPLRADRALFGQVRVNPVSGTIEWPGEVDLCADVLYGHAEPANGKRFGRRVVRAASAPAPSLPAG